MKINERTLKWRKAKDIGRNSTAYFFSTFGILILVLIIGFVFGKGYKYLSWDFLTSDYNITATSVKYQEETTVGTYEDPKIQNVSFSTRWGIGVEDSYDAEQKSIVIISYIDNKSPFNEMVNVEDDSLLRTELHSTISSGVFISDEGSYLIPKVKDGAKGLAETLDKANTITSLTLTTLGGGVRGSIISTLYMVVFTLLIALPLGVLSAIYLSLVAKQNKITSVLRSLIDLAGGIPTIIYGLVGAIIFIPVVSLVSGKMRGSILSGAFTLAIMLLPVIIKTTEESIKTVPSTYRQGSLALGASETQTIFKVVLPNALPGILTAVLLAIGRIIGESAALIYAMGTAIKDRIILTESSATLALHIYSLMQAESPNYGAACAVGLIIIIVDLILNLSVKGITYFFVRKFRR